jgi:hypothetical protein
MCNSNGHFFNGFRPNLQSHFAGIGGVWHRQGAASTSQPASNPPRGCGRMGDDRGGFAPTTPRCQSVVAPRARTGVGFGATGVARTGQEGPNGMEALNPSSFLVFGGF